jgi:multidrug efflux system membrane fusion protein
VSGLVGTKAVSQTDFDAKKNAVDVGEAQVKHAAAEVDTARLNLEYCTIRSPIDGRAGQRQVDVGNVVNSMTMGANATPMLTIQRLDPMYVEFAVTENDLTRVQQSMAKAPVKAEVRLPDDMANPRVGDLTFLDNAVQETTGTVRMRATIANEDRRFWPNRFVKVRLVLSTVRGAVLVPAVAVQLSAKGQFVYVVKDDMTAELRLVTPGQRHSDLVAINEGVAAGERVVINGQIGVTPGGKVRVVEGLEADLAAGASTGKENSTGRSQ